LFFQPTTAANPVEDLLIQEIDRQKSWDRRETRILWLYRQGFTQEEIALLQFTAENLDTEPEINFRHHYRLVDGILAQAYNKDDSETLDPEKAARHQKAWLKHIDEMSRARLRMHRTPEFLGPNYGAI
jgi:hypothetical protein